jgi:fucose permease
MPLADVIVACIGGAIVENAIGGTIVDHDGHMASDFAEGEVDCVVWKRTDIRRVD